MKPESKKNSEKRQLQINDDGGSTFDLSSLKEAINNEKTTKKTNSFDLTSMLHALPSLNRPYSNRKLHMKTVLTMKRRIKTVAEREAIKQRLLTLLTISDKYSCNK